MKRRLWVPLTATVFALGFWIRVASADDAFLDRTIPVPPENTSFAYLDQLQAMVTVVGKKVIFPPGLVDYASKEKLKVGYFTGIGPDKDHPFTIRNYLNNKSQEDVGLVWKYDAAQDAIVFDFAWHQPASRPAQELVDQLGKLSPRLPANPPRNFGAWRLALNELMSEPENFPHAWKVRLEDGCSMVGSFANSSFFGDEGVYAHILKDTNGKEHLLILNCHQPMVTPGPNPAIAYYLFAADGKWEDGGMFEVGTIFTPPIIKFEPDKNRATIEIIDHPLRFTTKNGPVIVNADRPLATYDDFLTINGGKLTATYLKNGNPLSPTDYAMGVTPLRHLGD